jgi:hypothetical protein
MSVVQCFSFHTPRSPPVGYRDIDQSSQNAMSVIRNLQYHRRAPQHRSISPINSGIAAAPHQS